MSSEKFSYATSGVDINKADTAKQEMKAAMGGSEGRVLNTLGAFASLFDFHFPEIESPVLVLKMEEPGSKQLLAAQHGRFSDIAYDLVNHLINDTVVMGACPLAILDTIVCGNLEKDVVVEFVRSMAEACRKQGCSLVGGETSEQPRVLAAGTYILSAACAGVVDKKKIIDGSAIQAGDVVLAVASNGVHTNGYTLVRSLLDANPNLGSSPVADKTFLEQILLPHTCYNLPLQKCFAECAPHGLAHITGGGVIDNTKRILPKNVDAIIDLAAIKVLPIFSAIQKAGKVEPADMLRTFNLGVGMTVVAAPSQVKNLTNIFKEFGNDCYQIGEIQAGSGQVSHESTLSW
jgi:phosphoribosylformylglycinamidine cyclo-ligase